MKCLCGERMEGDGVTVVLHCPDVDDSDRIECLEPDANPVMCNEGQLLKLRQRLDKGPIKGF